MSWRLGLTRLAAVIGGDLQAAARRAGGGRRLWEAGSRDLERWMRLDAEGLRRVIECRGAMHPRRELEALSERDQTALITILRRVRTRIEGERAAS